MIYTWKFFISILFISIKAQIFSIYLIIYHLFKHFAQAQLKSAMLIKKLKCSWYWEFEIAVKVQIYIAEKSMQASAN